jgi:hypothetical protein
MNAEEPDEVFGRGAQHAELAGEVAVFRFEAAGGATRFPMVPILSK